MAPNSKDYLVANVLNDSQIVSYRLLSRVLKVHINKAKEILYDFHKAENARKKGSVHATYLVAGVRKPDEAPKTNGTNKEHNEDDVVMSEDTFMSSSAPQPDDEEAQDSEDVKVTTVTLAKEVDLELIQKLYEEISSIHIYSVQSGSLNNLQALTECNRKVAADFISEDALETWKQYGTVRNPNAKRREGGRQPPPPPSTPPPPPPTTKQTDKPKATSVTAKAESRPTSSHSDKKQEVASGNSKTAPKAPTLKRESSSIMAAFGKAKKGTTSTAAPAAKAEEANPEDQPMLDADDEDEAGDEPMEEESAEAKEQAEARRKAREERQAQLRQMMDDDDAEDSKMDGDDDSELPPPPAEDEAVDPPPQAEQQAEQEQEQSMVSNGRRRGRRKVMKKKTTKDAEGYLVTKEEPVWESFSEDEAPAPKPTAKPSSFGAAKSSAGAAKKGQGNIMTFFKKG